MNKTLIFGHKSPDTDTIMSSLVMANLERKLGNDDVVACRLGDINKETQYALNYFKVDAPELIENVEDGTCVILVDHNEFAQSVNGIENAKIKKVVEAMSNKYGCIVAAGGSLVDCYYDKEFYDIDLFIDINNLKDKYKYNDKTKIFITDT